MRWTDWRDRLTYIVAEAQLLVAGLAISLVVLLVFYQPSLPGVPPWLFSLIFASLVLGPPLILGGVKFARWLRNRRLVEVHHVNAVEDTVEKWMVPPEVWAEKTVEGPDPWPVNGQSAWAVREFEYHEDTGDLLVAGIWLAECADDELLTSKSHMEDIYGWLLDRYRDLNRLTARVDVMVSQTEEQTVTAVAEAHERGTMLNKSAVSDVLEDAKSDVDDLDDEDVPTLSDADVPDHFADPAPTENGDAVNLEPADGGGGGD